MSVRFFMSRTSVFAVCAAASSISLPAYAQDAAAEGGLDEIVVTAEKRQSSEQKTPLALTVLSAETLARNSVGNIDDIARIAPSVSITNSGAAPVIAVRGVSSRDVTETGDPAIAVSVDGFNLQRATSLQAGFFDLERIEVLRGPQGTLLGRNATGGAINIITAKPDMNNFSAYLGGELGNYDLYSTKGMINLPLTDDLAIRASFQTRDRNGYRNNPGKDGDDEHTKAARLHFLYKPTSRLTVLVTGEYAHNDGVGVVIDGYQWRTYTATDAPPGFAAGDVVLSKPKIGNSKDFYSPPGGFMRYTMWNVRSEIDYDLDFATLTYTGGYRHFDFERKYAFGANPTSALRKTLSFEQYEDVGTWNHEVRLSSNSKGPLRWQFGGYYFKETNDYLGYFTDYPGQENMYGNPFVIQRFTYPDITAEAKALFGQASYEIVPGLTASVGARYSKDKKDRHTELLTTNFNTVLANRCDLTNSCVYTTSTGYQLAKSSKTTYHAGLDYQLTPRNMVYAKFDTGYKAGGFNEVGTYDPETVKSFEIGTKNRFFGNTLQINLAAYLYNYSNQQVSQSIINSAGGTTVQILNAGKSRYKGIELDTIWQPTPDDQLSAYIAYSHGRYVDFATSTSGTLLRYANSEGRAEAVFNGAGAIVGYNYQLAGKRPPQSPDWSINLGYQHDFHVLGGKLTPRAQTHIESKSYFQIYNFGTDKQDGYMRSDLMLTFTPDAGNWTLSAYVRNVEDTVVLSSGALPTSPNYQAYRYIYQAPRTFGGSVTFNW